MNNPRLRISLGLIALFITPELLAAGLPRQIEVHGDLGKKEGKNFSAVVVADPFVILGSDEGKTLRVFARTEHGLELKGTPIPLPVDGEADIEGLAIRKPAKDGRFTVFAIGCHCRNRGKVDDDESLAANRKAFSGVDKEGSRANVFRFQVDAKTGAPIGTPEHVSLTSVLKKDAILGPFTEIASKENGIDIEGLAIGPDGRLIAGFRGPVLRENFVPVLAFDFDDPKRSEVRWLNLGGLGIRDITAVKGGFLVLAGPVGDGRPDYRIFFWDGTDAIPGKGKSHKTVIQDLLEVPRPDPEDFDVKAEGLAVLDENAQRYEVLLVFDGPQNSRPTKLTVAKKP